MQKFRTIPAVGRAMIVVCALGVFAIAFVSCWTSYNAIYRLVSGLGLYGEKTNTVFPLLLDAAFLVAELAAALGVIMHRVTNSDDVSPVWPAVTMILCGVCTIVFNVAHAYLISSNGWADPMARVRGAVSALPPVLMILSFQVLIAIVKWVMLRLGRPEQAFGGVAVQQMVPNWTPQSEMPMSTGSRNGQNGHTVGGGEGTKIAAIQAVAAHLGPEEVTEIGAEGVAQYLATHHGVQTTPGYVRKVLEGRAGTSRNGKGHA